MIAVKSTVLLLLLLVQACAQKVELKSGFVDVKSVEVTSVDGKEFLRMRGAVFQGSSLSVKKVLIVRKGHRAEVSVSLGVVAQGENDVFEAMIPYDGGLKEVWLGAPLKRVWIEGKGLVKERKPDKLPPGIPPFNGD